MRTSRSLKGFTLIELLVVIAIIGILSSIVITSLNAAREKGRDAARISDINQIQLALSLYYDSCGQYPYTLTNGACGGLSPTYISVLPSDPLGASALNGGQYFYSAQYTAGASPVTCNSYHLGAVLEDSTNSVLANDGDFSGGTPCTGASAEFNGNSKNCGGTQSSPDLCYDVKP